MNAHRWWLALVATLLTPWIGPHVDGYLPLGWVLAQARSSSAGGGFWAIAGVLLSIAYGAWFALFSLGARLTRKE
jgi:hypothetical protein